MRRPNLMLSGLMLVSALLALAACESESSTAPFEGPEIAGKWTGTWREASVTMTLHQDGSNVDGVLLVNSQEFEIAGRVEEDGIFAWAGATTRSDDCIGMSSTLDDFQVQSRGNEMVGAARRNTRSADDSGPCGGRALVEQGSMQLERAF